MTGLPSYLQNIPAANLAETAIANVGAGSPPYLSIQGNRFTLIDAAGNTIPIQTLHVDVVIVDVNPHKSKVFFGLNKPYDPNNPTPPICFSDNGLAPSIGSSEPQSPTCDGCKHNVWGSKISQMGSAVKACADQQKIAIYVPEYSDGLFLLRIPPGSFDNWRSYMTKFVGAGLNPRMVTTRISFEQNVLGTLVFQSPGYITEQQAGIVIKMIEAKAADMMIGKLDKPRTVALPAPVQEVSLVSSLPAETSFVSKLPPWTPNISVAPSMPATTPQQPVQRRRRTKAEMEAARQQANPAPAQPVQALFRPDPPPAQPATSESTSQFGMVQNPPAPPPGLDLDAIFK